MARFTGSLDDLPVADLIQILQLAGKSAVITLAHDAAESRLWCANGAIVDADSGRLRGEAAVYRILSVERGWLSAELQSSQRPRSIFAATQRLLLEAARRKDESVALREQLGDVERYMRLAPGLDVEGVGCSPMERCLLRSFAEPRSLREAIESSELGDFETLTALAAWLSAGHLSATGVRESAPPDEVSGTSPKVAAATPTATLVPLVASARPRPGTERPGNAARSRLLGSWVWGALAALVLLPCGYLAGLRAAQVLEPPAPADSSSASALLPASYVVELRAQPSDAEIWLDGSKVAVGHWQANLLRNGSAHQLRLTAPGHLPVTLLFVDTAPPAEILLEELPAPPPERAAAITGRSAATAGRAAPNAEHIAPLVERAAPQPAASVGRLEPLAIEPSSEAAKARKRSVVRAVARRESAKTAQRPRPKVLGTVLSVANPPQVQATERADPTSRTLD